MRKALYLTSNFWNDNSRILSLLQSLKEEFPDDIFELFIPKNFLFSGCDFPTHLIDTSNIFHAVFGHKTLEKMNFDAVYNLGDYFPIFYKKSVSTLLPELDWMWYPNLENTKFPHKYWHQYAQKNVLKNSQTIGVFAQKEVSELNEKLNIEEEKLKVFPGFFPSFPLSKTQIEIHLKHSLNHDYVIFEGNISSSSNINRFLQAIKKVNETKALSVIFLGNELSFHIPLRQAILDLGIENNALFVTEIKENIIQAYYEQSLCFIDVNLYNHFPFHFYKALATNTPILASNHEAYQEIIGENACLQPLNSDQIAEKLATFERTPVDYQNLLQKYTPNAFVKAFFQ